MNEPVWLVVARKALGVAEVPGAKTSAVILQWLQRLRAWWADDETPWCGVFVAQCMDVTGFTVPGNWMRARAWLDWGIRLIRPAVGCVVVFERRGGGHVGFVVGQDAKGRLLVLGGNQGDRVSIVPFEQSRVLGFRWPNDEKTIAPTYFGGPLPVLAAGGVSSVNEA